jgi:hypothetical protein
MARYSIGSWNPEKTGQELISDPARLLAATASLGATEAPTVIGKKDYVTQAADKLNIGKTIGPPGGATPLLQQQANPYAASAGTMTPMQQQLAQQLSGLYGTGAGAMTGLIGQLQGQTRGDFGAAGSLGQQLLQQGMTKNLGDVRTQLASQRGLSPALAASIAATKQAELGGQTTQQAGILGLQQQMEAQKQLGGLASGAATLGSEGATRIGGQFTQADLESKRIQAGIAQANQAAQSADKARTVQAITGVLGGAAQVGAAAAGAAHGGRIGGEAPYAGDTPKNDVVPAQLSPGEIVIPRSAAGSKKAAKSFIESLDDWDEEPSYSKVLKARQKKNYSDGGQVGFPMSGPYAPVTQEKLDAATDRPLPAGQRLKTNIDDFLTGNVVEPLAQRGYPNLGAALATVPSVAAEMMIPSTTGELQGAVIPMPFLKGKALQSAKKAQALDLLEKMLADDVDISKLPSMAEYKKLAKDLKKEKLTKETEKLRDVTSEKTVEARKSADLSAKQIFGSTQNMPYSPAWVLDDLAMENLDNPAIKKAYDKVEELSKMVPHLNEGIFNLSAQKKLSAYEDARKNLFEILKENKDTLKFDNRLEEIKKVRKLPQDY